MTGLNSSGQPFKIDQNYFTTRILKLGKSYEDLALFNAKKIGAHGGYWPGSSAKYPDWTKHRVFSDKTFPKGAPERITTNHLSSRARAFATREPTELYLIRGEEKGTELVKFDLVHSREVFRVRMEKGTSDVFSEGAICVHSNGKIYALFSRFLYELDDSGKREHGERKIVLKRYDLFYDAAPSRAVYTGLVISPDGRVFSLGNWKSLSCGKPHIPSVVVGFQPEKNELVITRLSELCLGEITGDREFLYWCGHDTIRRLKVTKGEVKSDHGWSFPNAEKIPNVFPFRSTIVGFCGRNVHFFPKNKSGEKKTISLGGEQGNVTKDFLVDSAGGSMYVVFQDRIVGLSIEEERPWVRLASNPTLPAIIGPPDKRLLVVWTSSKKTVRFVILSVYLAFLLIIAGLWWRFLIKRGIVSGKAIIPPAILLSLGAAFPIHQAVEAKPGRVEWIDAKTGTRVYEADGNGGALYVQPVNHILYGGTQVTGLSLLRAGD